MFISSNKNLTKQKRVFQKRSDQSRHDCGSDEEVGIREYSNLLAPKNGISALTKSFSAEKTAENNF
jgi:hypothetical protein